MTTLHMDVGTVSNVQTKLVQSHSTLTQTLGEITTAINNINNSTGWVGASATEFFTKYTTLKGELDKKLIELNDLAAALKKEIAQWNTMQEHLTS